MHDLVQQMGHEIIGEQKERQGLQSRLWEFDDIQDALTNYWGTSNVEAIQLCRQGEIDISSEAFIHMHKLRYLNLESGKIKCPKGLEFLPNNIKYLRWTFYPLSYLPSNYNAVKLVVLDMHCSKLEEIDWSKPLMNLKRVDLFFSFDLMKISDLAMAPNLEELKLSMCPSLVEVGSSLENLNKLTSFDVGRCKSLSHLPELPCSIQKLGLEASGLRGLPSTIGNLTLLTYLSLRDCTRLESLPSSISGLSSLILISLSGCKNLQELPEDFGKFESLEVLDASDSGLRELPRSIQNLKNLVKLDLSGCNDLTKLPEDIGNLESLKELDASYSGLIELPLPIPNLKNLIKLDLTGCLHLMKLPEDIRNLESLQVLCASRSGLRALPSSFQNLRSLIKLDLRDCQNLLKLPDDIGNMHSLKELYASGSGLSELPQFIQTQNSLKKFKIRSLDVIKLSVLGIWVPNRSSNSSGTRVEKIPKP